MTQEPLAGSDFAAGSESGRAQEEGATSGMARCSGCGSSATARGGICNARTPWWWRRRLLVLAINPSRSRVEFGGWLRHFDDCGVCSQERHTQ